MAVEPAKCVLLVDNQMCWCKWTLKGGQLEGAYRYIARYGVPDETCQPYQALEQSCNSGGACKPCKRNFAIPEADCPVLRELKRFKISRFDSTDAGPMSLYTTRNARTENIMLEIYRRGPVSCTLFATDKFDAYTEGIYQEHDIHWKPNHIVSLVGWGEENGIPYWIGRNSWGTYWGENGFFRIIRGEGRYNLNIENGCTWAEPDIPEHFMPEDPLPDDVVYGEYLLNLHDSLKKTELSPNKYGVKKGHHKKPSRKTMKPSHKETHTARTYDIRNLNGVNFASINRNQNVPSLCESSWAQAATSALNDRFSLLNNASHPQIALSAQVLLNCVNTKRTRACNGGDVADAYDYIKHHGLTDETCSPYKAKASQCNQINICKSCWPDKCYPLKPGEYATYSISAYGQISGDDSVKKEILENGPVACRICDSNAFLSYTNGIFSDPSACKSQKNSRKYVVLSGWGEKDGEEYWIGRNSWGTYWGEQGWFKLRMGVGDLGITRECHWATPIQPDSLLHSMNKHSPIARIKSEAQIHHPKQPQQQQVTTVI